MGIAQQSGIVSPAYNVYVPKAGFASAYIDKLVQMQNFADEALAGQRVSGLLAFVFIHKSSSRYICRFLLTMSSYQ